MDDPTRPAGQPPASTEPRAQQPVDWPWPEFPTKARRQYDPFDGGLTGWEGDFLEAYRNTGIMRSACQEARVSQTLVYKRRKIDAVFSRCFDEAREQAVDILEAAAFQRAVYGTKRTIHKYFNGKVIEDGDEIVTTYSDTLLMFLLRANSPKYREAGADRTAQIAAAKAEAARLADAAGWSPERKQQAVDEVERMLRSSKG